MGEDESICAQNVKLKSSIDHKEKKISAQNQRIKELASLLQDEKKKSWAVIDSGS